MGLIKLLKGLLIKTTLCQTMPAEAPEEELPEVCQPGNRHRKTSGYASQEDPEDQEEDPEDLPVRAWDDHPFRKTRKTSGIGRSSGWHGAEGFRGPSSGRPSSGSSGSSGNCLLALDSVCQGLPSLPEGGGRGEGVY